MLATRLAVGALLIAVLIAILALDEWFAPWFPLWFAASLGAMTLCAVEMGELLSGSGRAPSRGVVLGGVAALVVANWVPHVAAISVSNPVASSPMAPIASGAIEVMAWPLWTFVALLMASFVVQSARFRGPGSAVSPIASTNLVLAYVGLLGCFIIQMRWLDGPYHGLIPLGLLLFAAKGSDTGAYFVGRWIGRHKLWPQISPNKTIEGSAGGLLAGMMASIGFSAFARFVLDAPTLGWVASAFFGFSVAAVAQLGDLMESMIKRDCERKDASSAVPGFGGMLDVLDSLLFSAPVAYGFWVWFHP